MALSREGQSHDVETTLWYYKADAPKTLEVETKFGKFQNMVLMGKEAYTREGRPNYMERMPATIVDGRTHLPGGKEAWDFDEHGFVFIETPDYDFEDHLKQDRRRVNREFGPKVAEACRVACKAKTAFWLSHQRRAEPEVGTLTEGYARDTPHSDYGPDYEAQVRGMLTARFGVPEQEAQSCGVCLVNMWAPVERPAYKNPLALLDGGSISMEENVGIVRYQSDGSFDNGYGYYNGFDTKDSLKGADFSTGENTAKGPRPLAERVPQAAVDAPSLGPCYAPGHRFVYLPDMTRREAAIFKQYDFRKAPKAKATFHCAINDRFHDGWKDCPGRRSIECRVVLLYDPEPSAKL